MTQLTSKCFVPCDLPSQRTLSDNSTTHFVLRGAQEGRDFSSKARLAADNSSANCHLRVSFVDARPSANAVPAIGCDSSPKNSLGQIAKISERKIDLSRLSMRPPGQLPFSFESSIERQVPGIQPSRHHSSIIIHRSSSSILLHSILNQRFLNPALNPPSPAALRSVGASARERPPPGLARGRPC